MLFCVWMSNITLLLIISEMHFVGLLVFHRMLLTNPSWEDGLVPIMGSKCFVRNVLQWSSPIKWQNLIHLGWSLGTAPNDRSHIVVSLPWSSKGGLGWQLLAVKGKRWDVCIVYRDGTRNSKGDLLTYHSLDSFNFMIAEIPSALFRLVAAAASQWILHAIDIANTRSEQIH